MLPDRETAAIADWIASSPDHRAYRSNLAATDRRQALILAYRARMMRDPKLINEAVTGLCQWPSRYLTLDQLEQQALDLLAMPPVGWSPARVDQVRAARLALRDMIASRDELSRQSIHSPYQEEPDHE